MSDFVSRMMSQMDEDAARELLNNIDEQEIHRAMEWVTEDMVVPHLRDVEVRARSAPPPSDVRDYYSQMPVEQREDEFYEALDELVATLVECRESPRKGFDQLKTMLRDPYTIEALLLIFDGEDPETGEQRIDPEYEDQLKDFAAIHLRWVGAMVLPEMYDRATVESVLDRFNLTEASGDAGFPGGDE